MQCDLIDTITYILICRKPAKLLMLDASISAFQIGKDHSMSSV